MEVLHDIAYLNMQLGLGVLGYILIKSLKIWFRGSGRTVWGKAEGMIFINRQGLDALGGSSLVRKYWNIALLRHL